MVYVFVSGLSGYVTAKSIGHKTVPATSAMICIYAKEFTNSKHQTTNVMIRIFFIDGIYESKFYNNWKFRILCCISTDRTN